MITVTPSISKDYSSRGSIDIVEFILRAKSVVTSAFVLIDYMQYW